MSAQNPGLTPQVNSNFGTLGGLNYWQLPGGASVQGMNLTLLSAQPCQLVMVSAGNINASARYVKIYDVAALAMTSLAGVPSAQTYIVPGNVAGAGSNIVSAGGQPFAAMQLKNGLAVAIAEAAADTAQSGIGVGDCVLNVWWK